MIQCNSKKSCTKKCDKHYTFFTQFLCEDNIIVPDKKPAIEDIVSVIVDPEIVSLRIINTPIGCSAEGQKLTGKKLSIEIKMRQKILYISKCEVQSVHAVENECYKSVYIIIPKCIHGSDVEHLLNQKYIDVDVKIENTSAIKVDERNIYKSIVLFIKAKIKCSYLLCYSENYKYHGSELCISYEDGSKKRTILCFDEGKIVRPKWSPCGQRIAYIYSDKNCSCIHLSDIKGNYTYELTDKNLFKHITSFSWCRDGANIVFTAYLKNNSEIYSINLNTLECEQLTYGKYGGNSIKPKYSFDGEHIAYIRCSGDSSILYVMDKSGLGAKRITKLDNVIDFAWENNDLRIAVACKDTLYYEDNNTQDYSLICERKGNEIILIDLNCNEMESLNISEFNLNIREIRFAQNNRYISFIGERLGIEDIFLYDLLKNEIINLTENEFGINIDNYDWNIDSTGIYYSSNELHYYNVYYIYICDKSKVQITNSKSSSIQLSYRPKIV